MMMLLAAAGAIAACSSNSDSTGIRFKADGSWRASSVSGTTWYQPQLLLSENDAGSVTGQLVFLEPPSTSHLSYIDVKGKQQGSKVTLTWGYEGSWQFVATVTPGSLDGTLSNGQATYPQTFTRP